MNVPTMLDATYVTEDVACLPAYLPVPDLGLLPVNSFVVKAREPMLIDTGLKPVGPAWAKALESVIEPERILWVYLTHVDPDHIGNLSHVLESMPEATVLTSFLGLGKLQLHGFDLPRVQLVGPGTQIDLGDRILSTTQVPFYDAPETLGIVDHESSIFFSSDCFGAVLEKPLERAEELAVSDLTSRIVQWASIDAPWCRDVKDSIIEQRARGLRDLAPEWILSSHLPPTRRLDLLLETLI